MNRIKYVLFLGALFALAGIDAQRALADTPQLQDLWFNTGGGSANFAEEAVTQGSIDLTTLYNENTGLGTITFVDTTGIDFFDVYINESVAYTQYYNEYTSISGSPATGESYETGPVPYVVAEGGYDDTQSSTFLDAENATSHLNGNGTNGIPGQTDNFLNECLGSVSTCNGDVGVALAQSYSVNGDGDEEIITVTAADSCGSGICIEQINPNEDSQNSGRVGNVYYSLDATYVPEGSGPSPTPEPSTWLLMLTGLAIPAWRMRRRFAVKTWAKFTALLAVVAVALGASARAQLVETVPWVPSNTATPHTAYLGASVVLGAVFIPASGHSSDSYTYTWCYGDTTCSGTNNVTNFLDISSSHTYTTGSNGTPYTATVTVTDTSIAAPNTWTGNYPVIIEANSLQTRVNIAIDWGLWYLHQNMYRYSTTQGTWRGCAGGYSSIACGGYESQTATNAQAFEVNGHLPNGPSTDPYTLDVQEALADIVTYLQAHQVGTNTYYYNPAKSTFDCSDGSAPTTTNQGTPVNPNYCAGTATQENYNTSAASCPSPPCTFTFDGNSNNQWINDPSYQSWGYEQGMIADALVASNAPTMTAAGSLPTPYYSYPSGIGGNPDLGHETFYNIVQDMVDGVGYCQYGYDYDVSAGYTRGQYYGGNPGAGGGWLYDCNTGDDNSTSQWSAILAVAANRGFGITIPPIVEDANQVWVTNSQTTQIPDDQLSSTYNGLTVDNPSESATYNYGGFGYRGSLYYYEPWGPWATTPSGMVQMALDGVGRTANTQFNNYIPGEYPASPGTSGDQRFNNAETYYADNFCDNPSAGQYYAPLAYTYGLFSFTKSMLEHDPGGSLSPIQYLRTLTPSVFTTNSSVPANTIDWYAALTPAHGGTDPCDGVAQNLVERQRFNGFGDNGDWYGTNANGAAYDYETAQANYETGWALIMLQKSVFVTCVNNLEGAGTASKLKNHPAVIALGWSGISSATGYQVWRSSTLGGTYTEIGTTTNQSYADTTVANGQTYYYYLEPTNSGDTQICQSNIVAVKVP